MKKSANAQSNTNLSITNNQLHVSALYSHHQGEYRTINRKNYNKMRYLWFCVQPDDGCVQPKHVADCWLCIKLCWTVRLHASSFACELKPVNACAAVKVFTLYTGGKIVFLLFCEKIHYTQRYCTKNCFKS